MLMQPVGTQVTISNDHVQDVDALAKRLVLIRERTEVCAPLLEAAAQSHLEPSTVGADGLSTMSSRISATPYKPGRTDNCCQTK